MQTRRSDERRPRFLHLLLISAFSNDLYADGLDKSLSVDSASAPRRRAVCQAGTLPAWQRYLCQLGLACSTVSTSPVVHPALRCMIKSELLVVCAALASGELCSTCRMRYEARRLLKAALCNLC